MLGFGPIASAPLAGLPEIIPLRPNGSGGKVGVRYAVRRAKNRAERAQGKRWIAQAEFPGGRVAVLKRDRTRPPTVQKLRQEVRNVVQQAANAGVIDIKPQSASAGIPSYKSEQIRGIQGRQYNID